MRKRSTVAARPGAAHAVPLHPFKNAVLYFLILPLRIGISGPPRRRSGASTLTPTALATYVLRAERGTWRPAVFGWRAALAALSPGSFFYFGFLELPWPVFIARGRAAGMAVAGPGVACSRSHGCLFILRSALAAAYAVALSLRVGSPALPAVRRPDRGLGRRITTGFTDFETDQRCAADDAAIRLPDPCLDVLQGRRVHGTDRDHALRHRAAHPLCRARASPCARR